MFTSDPTTDIFLFEAVVCAVGVVLGIISIILLPWSDEEIEAVDRSARRTLSGFVTTWATWQDDRGPTRPSPMGRAVGHRAIRT